MSPATLDERLRFGRFEISPAERVLRVDGVPAALGARAFDVLLALAQRRDRLVGKQELLELVWPGVVVEEHNIAAQVSTLRKLLGAHAVATIPGRGYRFTAPLTGGSDEPADTPATTAAAPPAPTRTHLPRELTPLLGRDDEPAALAALLDRYRLVTLLGAGGMGKSLLAQHLLRRLADEYEHGVCWVELASVDDAAEVSLRIARALGVHPGPGEPLAGLCAAASSLTMLLALDNAEHVLPAVAQAAAALLEAAPGLSVIVTSQAPLRLGAERIYRVGPLAVPKGPLPLALASTFGAVALFCERAHGVDARFALGDADAPAIIELCRGLDGLPLAIELAAARAPLLGVRQLAASMDDRLRLLTRNRDAAAPERQQTLRAALEWSHGFLDEHERTVFRRLGVMADSASLYLIQQVVADEGGALDGWAVLDALGTLVDRSLVAVLGDDADSSRAPREVRYRLLESARLFALERLRAAGEEDMLRRRHAGVLAALFDTAWADRWSGSVAAGVWAGRILADASNARDAIAWAEAAGEMETVVRIGATLYQALPRYSHLERVALAVRCESLAERLPPTALRLRAFEVAVQPMFHPSQQRSLDLAASALELARELDRHAPDRWQLYQALALWVGAASVVTKPGRAAIGAAVDELTRLEDPRWPPHRLAWGLDWMRWAPMARSDRRQAADETRAVQHRWVAALEAAGDDTDRCVGSVMDAEIQCGHLDEAIRMGEAALARWAGSRDEWSRSMVQSNLSLAYLAMGSTAAARPLLQAVWPLAERWNMCAQCADMPPLLAALDGRPRAAALLAGYADAAVAARGLIRHPLEAEARERSRALARTALGDAAFDRLHAKGGALRDHQVPELAFATADAP